MTVSWWADALHPRLSQGDVLAEVLFATPAHPVTPLKKGSTGRGVAWEPLAAWTPDDNGRGMLLAAGRRGAALVLSHSCDLDKKHDKGKGRVLVAPMPPLAGLSPGEIDAIRAQKPWHRMPLPAVPALGDCYADLRSITFIDRRVAEDGTRLASMTSSARMRLMAQLVAFFTRVDPAGLAFRDADDEANGD